MCRLQVASDPPGPRETSSVRAGGGPERHGEATTEQALPDAPRGRAGRWPPAYRLYTFAGRGTLTWNGRSYSVKFRVPLRFFTGARRSGYGLPVVATYSQPL